MKYLLLIIAFFTLASPAYAVTYATWDSSNCDASMVLSGGSLVITKSGSAWKGCRGTLNKTTGKWYWEILAGTFGGTGQRSGIGNSSSLLTGLDDSFNSLLYDRLTGDGIKDGAVPWTGTSYTVGDTVGYALDADADTFKIYKNNTLQGTFTTITTNGNFPYMATFDNGDVVTANFGATALTYAPPAGYCAGLADVCPTDVVFQLWPFSLF